MRKYILLLLLLFFTVLMIRITLTYIPIQTDVSFLRIKQDYIAVKHWLFSFFLHAFTSTFLLLAGFTQFSAYILKKYKRIHRLMGHLYVWNILVLTGPASLVMGCYANGGLFSRIAFVSLSVLWIYYTLRGFIAAIRKNFTLHRDYLIRSYALTLSAITLRAWKFLLSNAFDIPPMDLYRIVAWLGWVLNLIIAERIIYTLRNRNKHLLTTV
jgi:hypothetical protein